MSFYNAKRGASLIETVIYVALLAVFSVVIVSSLIMMAQAFGKARIQRKVTKAGSDAMERIVREVRLAYYVNNGQPAGQYNMLNLTTYQDFNDLVNCGITRSFSVNGSRLQMSDGVAQNLTPADVTVGIPTFTKLTDSTRQDAVRIEFTVSAGSGKYASSRTFYGTAVTRTPVPGSCP